jgi:hypothetical protein
LFRESLARKILSFLFWTLLFGIAYTQPPLYYSNQHQYFLHGLAKAGFGFLDHDWLANTADPAPVFTALVAFTYRYLHPVFYYAYYILILGVYFHAFVGIFDYLSGGLATGLKRLGFRTLLVVLHSALFRWLSAKLFGVDYPWYFQAGVANQYILGAGLQPSVFGVLLLLSVSTFLRNRPYLAATWAGLAGVMHSTYLLTAALLTLSYLYLLLRAGKRREAVLAAAWTLLVVSPVVIYNLVTFAPSSPETFAEAQRLLAHNRIPHHTQIYRWLDGIAWAQIGWILLALGLVWDSRLFVILFVCFAFSLALSLLQAVTGNDTLALLFPWRASSVLVPLATGIIMTRIVNWLGAPLPVPMGIVYGFALAIAALGGVWISYFGLGYRTNTQELELLAFVRDNKTSGEVYLLPVEVPKLTSGKRGAASHNFMPPPQRNSQKQNISVDLQQFRLFTGAPIYIDFKSIPYKDVEVLEWHRRLQWNQQLYERGDWNDDDFRDELMRRAITHVVVTVDCDRNSVFLKLVHEDANYRLYRVRE